MLLIYVVIGTVIYAGIYYLVLSQKSSNPYSKSKTIYPTTISDNQSGVDYLEFHGKIYSYKYPSTWKNEENQSEDFRFAATSPDFQFQPRKGASFMIIIDNPQPDMKSLNDYIKSLNLLPDGYKLIKVDGLSAIQYDSEVESGSPDTGYQSLDSTAIILYRQNKVVELYYGYERGQKEKYLKHYNTFVESFKFN